MHKCIVYTISLIVTIGFIADLSINFETLIYTFLRKGYNYIAFCNVTKQNYFCFHYIMYTRKIDRVLFVCMYQTIGYYLSACSNRWGTIDAKMTGYYFAGVLFVRDSILCINKYIFKNAKELRNMDRNDPKSNWTYLKNLSTSKPANTPTWNTDCILNSPITEQEIFKMLNKCKNGKASRPADDIIK